jgi:hypothetical protein
MKQAWMLVITPSVLFGVRGTVLILSGAYQTSADMAVFLSKWCKYLSIRRLVGLSGEGGPIRQIITPDPGVNT